MKTPIADPVISRIRVRPPTRARGANSNWDEIYLVELEKHGQKAKAAAFAGVTIRAVQKRRAADPLFAREEADAMAVAKDLVESEIFRRAIDGVQTLTVTKNGSVVTSKTEYSDQLLLRIAERLETGSWRQKQQVEHSASPLQFATREERRAAIERARQEIAAGKAKLAEKPIVPPLPFHDDTECTDRPRDVDPSTDVRKAWRRANASH